MTAGPGGTPVGTRHPVKIFANIFISFIGAGVLGLPFAFKEAGILEGILIMTCVGIISVKAMLLIIDCKYKLLEEHKVHVNKQRTVNTTDFSNKTYLGSEDNDQDGLLEAPSSGDSLIHNGGGVDIEIPQTPTAHTDLSYGDVGYYALGHTGRTFVDLSIVVSQAGFCCAYLIFIVENLSDYIHGVKLIHWLLLLLPPLCLMTLLRHLGSLALTSLMAQLSNLMAFGVVFWFDFEHFHSVEIHPKKMSIRGLPFFLAISIYCYEGAGMILSLEGSIAEDIRPKFKKFFVSTMILVTTLYITFGSCGYLSFGPETNPIITLNLPKGDSFDFAMIVKSFLCLALFFTYPVMMFPVMKILESYLVTDAHKYYWKGNILRMCMVMITGVIVICIPNFANLMALVGASCCTMLAFLLPGLFHMAIFKGSLSIKQVIVDWTLIFLGVLGAIVGTIDALKRLHESTHPEIEYITNTTSTTIAVLTQSLGPTTPNGITSKP